MAPGASLSGTGVWLAGLAGMDKSNISHGLQLAGIGLLAGLAGTLAMSLSQSAEMRLTGRKPSDVPAKAVETLVQQPIEDDDSEKQLSTAAHFAFGTSLGLGLAAMAKVPEPVRGAAFFAGAWATGTTLITSLGLSDPPTRWKARQLATDLGHHAVYAATAAAAFFGLRRLARV